MRAYGALETYLPTLSKTGSYPEAPTINLPGGIRLQRAGTPANFAPDFALEGAF